MDRVNWIFQIVINLIMYIHTGNCNNKLATKTNFSCLGKTAGFYADVDNSCKIYHTCDEYGNKFTYHCPEETAFRQDALICDHVHLVDCQRISLIAEKNINNKQGINSSYVKGSMDDAKKLLSVQSLPITQRSSKVNDRMQHGFPFSSNVFFKYINGTGINENVMNTFYTITNNFNFTKDTPDNSFKRIKMQYTPSISQSHQSTTNNGANFSFRGQLFNDNIKFHKDEKVNQSNYLNHKINNTSNDYLKLFQENNLNNNQTSKNFRNFLKPISTNHRNYPYSETLKSIQRSSKLPLTDINIAIVNASSSTTEIPLYALTLSLEPLVPHELEHDPYYPKHPSSTEAYYTPSLNIKNLTHTRFSTETTWIKTQAQLPSILPDLNSLEDIVDRRKLYYISKIRSND